MRPLSLALIVAPALALAQAWPPPSTLLREGGGWGSPSLGDSVLTIGAASTGPMMEDDAGTVCHAWWNGSAIQDTKGCSWTQHGTVPQVSTSPFYPAGFGGAAKAGAGPFSVANYYSLGAGSDALDFAGDFYLCAVTDSAPQSGGGANIFANETYNVEGYTLWDYQIGTIVPTLETSGPGTVLSAFSAGDFTATNFRVVCGGRAGSNMVVKASGQSYASAAATAITLGTNSIAKIGTGDYGAFNGHIYELIFEAATPTAAIYEKIQNRVLGQIASFGEPLTVTRATTATDVIGGVLYTFPVNVARTDANGLFSEAAATNLALQNTAIDNAAWTKLATGTGSAPTVTANATAAPDLTTTADNVVYPVTTTSTAGSVVQMPFTGTAAAYSASVWLKKSAGSGNIFLSLNTAGASFSRTNCAITTAWSYCTLPNITLTAATWNLEVGVDSRDASQTGQAAQTVAVWGAQAELGAFPTSMIYTAGTSVTRNADQFSASNQLSTGDNDWCIDATFTPESNRAWAAADNAIWAIGACGGLNSACLKIGTDGNAYCYVGDASALGGRFFTHGYSAGSTHRLTCCDRGGTVTIYSDGVLQTGSSAGGGSNIMTAMPTTFYVASESGSRRAAGNVSKVRQCRSSDVARCAP